MIEVVIHRRIRPRHRRLADGIGLVRLFLGHALKLQIERTTDYSVQRCTVMRLHVDPRADFIEKVHALKRVSPSAAKTQQLCWRPWLAVVRRPHCTELRDGRNAGTSIISPRRFAGGTVL